MWKQLEDLFWRIGQWNWTVIAERLLVAVFVRLGSEILNMWKKKR